MISIGLLGIIQIVSHLFFICITWYILQGINLNAFIRKGRETEAKIILLFITWYILEGINLNAFIRKCRETEAKFLLLFITIVIGIVVSRFFLDILQWSQDLNYLL